jgi:hypothetical protein
MLANEVHVDVKIRVQNNAEITILAAIEVERVSITIPSMKRGSPHTSDCHTL